MTPPGASTAAARARPAVRRAKPRPPEPTAAEPKAAAAPPRQAPKRKARPPVAPATRSRGGRAAPTRERHHRRVSGPARGRAKVATAPRLPSLPAPALPARLRRVRLRPLPVLGTIGGHAYRAGRALPDSPLLDRLLRGRVWIGLLAVLLLGLVFLNVSLLELNSAAGRNVENVKALRIQNDRLHAKVSRLQGGDRLERVAGGLGLVMPEPGSIRYLSVGERNAERAARALRAGRREPLAGSLEGTIPAAPESGTALALPAPAPTPTPTADETALPVAPAQPQPQTPVQQTPVQQTPTTTTPTG